MAAPLFDGEHRRIRDRLLASGYWLMAPCPRCGLPMRPGEPLDLDHNDARTGYLGLSLSFNLISIHIRLYMAYSLIYLIAVVGTAVSLILGVATQPGSREETAVTVTLPCPDAVLQTAGAVPDLAGFTDAVAPWRGLQPLRGFPAPLYRLLPLRS